MEVIDFPAVISAGDSISVTASLPDYPASDGWSVTLVVVNATANYKLTSTASGDDHVIAALPLVTDAWAVGLYKWVAFAVKGTSQRIRVSTGDLEVRPDITDAGTYVDLRTHAEKVLAAIEAVLEGKASTDDFQVNVRGKMLTRYSYEELLKLRKVYRAEVYQERRARKKAQGKPGSSQVRVRF